MSLRYLFLCPDRKTSSGGIAVIYDIVALLNSSGHEAAVVHNTPHAVYPDYQGTVPKFFTRRVINQHWNHSGLRQKLKILRDRGKTKSPRLTELKLRPSDVIVIPEFWLPEGMEAFPDQCLIVFVQNPYALMRAYDRAQQRGLSVSDRISYWLGMSAVCRSHFEMLQLKPTAYFPVSMKPHEFCFSEKKQNLISYMPRKRPLEARIIAHALKQRLRGTDYRLEALDNLPRAAVAKKLSESRIFVSLLHREGLGFPAAEAMASGCIVVGFDGLGGAEFFDKTTGVPVTEGDVPGIVSAIENILVEYEENPERLDTLRRNASEYIRDNYSKARFENGILSVWSDLENALPETVDNHGNDARATIKK